MRSLTTVYLSSKNKLHIDTYLYVQYTPHIDNHLYEECMTENEISEICKALGDVNRIKIINMLTQGELCACRLLEKFNITQPTLSHHMKILSETNLVNVRKDGKWSYYSINNEVIKEAKSYFEKIDCCSVKAKENCCSCKGGK